MLQFARCVLFLMDGSCKMASLSYHQKQKAPRSPSAQHNHAPSQNQALLKLLGLTFSSLSFRDVTSFWSTPLPKTPLLLLTPKTPAFWLFLVSPHSQHSPLKCSAIKYQYTSIPESTALDQSSLPNTAQWLWTYLSVDLRSKPDTYFQLRNPFKHCFSHLYNGIIAYTYWKMLSKSHDIIHVKFLDSIKHITANSITLADIKMVSNLNG